MKKIYIVTFYEVQNEDGSETKSLKARTEGNVSESSLNSIFEIHAEKVGSLERKLLKDQAEQLSKEHEAVDIK